MVYIVIYVSILSLCISHDKDIVNIYISNVIHNGIYYVYAHDNPCVLCVASSVYDNIMRIVHIIYMIKAILSVYIIRSILYMYYALNIRYV